MSDVLMNTLVCGVFVISSVVILKCLKKMGMKAAYITYSVLALVLSLYIPLFFCGKLLCEAFEVIMPDSKLLPVFLSVMEKMADIPFTVMQIATVLTAVVSAVVTVAVVILTANMTVYVIKRIKRAVSAYEAKIKKPSLKEKLFRTVLSNQDISYKRFCRLLS